MIHPMSLYASIVFLGITSHNGEKKLWKFLHATDGMDASCYEDDMDGTGHNIGSIGKVHWRSRR